MWAYCEMLKLLAEAIHDKMLLDGNMKCKKQWSTILMNKNYVL